MRPMTRNLLAMVLMALVSACSTNPITGRSQLIGLVSEQEAIDGSSQAYRQMMADLDKKKQIERGADAEPSPRAAKVQESPCCPGPWIKT